MKKFLSILICICLLSSALPLSAEELYLELNSLKYDEYMRGETIRISGSTNHRDVLLGLYYPEHYGATVKFITSYSSQELQDGVELETGTESHLWPDGVWTIVVQAGDISESLEFTLSETVDRSEDEPENEPTEKPTRKPSTGNNSQTVTFIVPDKIETTLSVGESEKINITTSASSLSLEIEDETVTAASLSGKTLTITALKRGTSTIWVKTNNNYANINVTVVPAKELPTEEPTERPTEGTTEAPTESPTEEVTEPENPFEDLPDSHWAKESILALYSKGIINGMDSDTFAPDSFITRAQFVTMLTKAFDLETSTASSPFKDVSENDWYFAAVLTAYENGITQGDYAGNFNPNNLVTRQDMATLAYRTALAKGISFPTAESALFDDHIFIKDYAVDAVYAMRSASIINGMSETTFEPLGNATRAQAAHIIAKLIKLK